MMTKTRFSTRLVPAAAIGGLALSAFILVAFGGHIYNSDAEAPKTYEGDYDRLASVEELASASDRVMHLEIGDVIGEVEDRGGDPEVDPASGEPIRGIPMIVVEAVVQSSAFAGSESGETVLIAVPNSEAISADFQPLRKGDRIVLFGKLRDARTAPDLAKFGDFFVPVSGDNGVFDVSESRATARSTHVLSLNRDDAQGQATVERPRNDRFSATLGELSQVVARST